MNPLRENTPQESDTDDYNEIQDSLLIPYRSPAAELKEGDTVAVNSGITPALVFTITEIHHEADQLMACGEYGCFAVELLIRR